MVIKIRQSFEDTQETQYKAPSLRRCRDDGVHRSSRSSISSGILRLWLGSGSRIRGGMSKGSYRGWFLNFGRVLINFGRCKGL